MLCVCENIGEALALSGRWHIALLVFVHGDSPAGGEKSADATFARGGAAQRQALEEVLRASRLAAVTVVHFVAADSEAHRLFAAAVPAAAGTVPRLHVFSPAPRQDTRQVLHGASLTPERICETIRFALQVPFLARANETRGQFMRQVEEMNAAVPEAPAKSFFLPGVRPSESVSLADNNAAGASGSTSSFSSPIGAATAGRNFEDAHHIVLDGLEKREVVATSPGMMLSTIWKKVQQALNSKSQISKEETQACGGTTFALRIDLSVSTKSANKGHNAEEAAGEKMMVDSADAAAKIDIHALPHNSVVSVVKGNAAIATPRHRDAGSYSKSPAEKKTVGSQERDERTKVHCEGGVCRIGSLPPSSKPSSQEQKTGNAHAPSHTTAAANSLIHVRCSLPDGRTHTVDGLDPTIATLSTHLRGIIAGLICHDNFVFARVYPFHRFSSDEESQPLQAIGLCASSALRVIITGEPAPASAAETRHVSPGSGLLALFSRLRRGDSAPCANAAPPANAARRTGGRIRTMVDVHKEEEEEEEEEDGRSADVAPTAAMTGPVSESRRKKVNRYYGGNSTEYLGAESDSDDDEKRQKGRTEKKEGRG